MDCLITKYIIIMKCDVFHNDPSTIWCYLILVFVIIWFLTKVFVSLHTFIIAFGII